MSVSLREIYNKIEDQSNEDLTEFNFEETLNSNDKYKSLKALQEIVNTLNKERSDKSNNISCVEHKSFEIKDDTLTLNKIENKIPSIASMTCEELVRKDCTCESLGGCECDTRTMTCESVVSYSDSVLCTSRTTANSSCECNNVGATGTYYYIYYYTYAYITGYSCGCQVVAYLGSTLCYNNNEGYNGCTCAAVYPVCYCNSVYATYAYTTGSTTGTSYYYYNYALCASRTTYSTSCECNSRTTTNPCSCNTRSEALCATREGCTCNQVCTCNTVKEFEF
jgi:hypothetical protein